MIMAWKVYLPSGTVEVGSADLKRMAANGEIEKSTIVESTTNKVRTQASGIAGLVFREPPKQEPEPYDLPAVEVPNSPPPLWNPPEDRRAAFQDAPWATSQKAATKPKKTFFMDYNFDFLITPSLLSMLWILWLALGALSVVLSAFLTNAQTGGQIPAIVGAVLVSLMGFVFSTIVVRVALETIIVIFKICEYLKRLDEKS